MPQSSSISSTGVLTNTPPPPPPVVQNARHYLSIKLNPHNYLFWKTQISPFLCSQSLMGYIDGSVPPPPTHLTSADPSAPPINTEFLSWQQQDQLVVSILLSTLSEEAFPLIVGLTTSSEIWTSLARAYASPSNTRILQLHEALHELKQRDLSVTAYLYIAKNISDSLAVAGCSISAADLNVYIFKGLRPEFRDLTTTLNARPEAVSFDDLHALLLSHDYIHGRPAVEAISPVAHLTGTQMQHLPDSLLHPGLHLDAPGLQLAAPRQHLGTPGLPLAAPGQHLGAPRLSLAAPGQPAAGLVHPILSHSASAGYGLPSYGQLAIGAAAYGPILSPNTYGLPPQQFYGYKN